MIFETRHFLIHQWILANIGLGLLIETGEIEAGYSTRKDYWGRVLGTELLKGLTVAEKLC